MFHGLRLHPVSPVVTTSGEDIPTVVFIAKHGSNEELKQRVKVEIVAILEQMTRRGRLEKCLRNGGGGECKNIQK
jgi:hypothetical protein